MRWQVAPVGDIWSVFPPLKSPYALKTFDTLPEAHTYAMRMSRTVEVELPEVDGEVRIQGGHEGSFPMTVGWNWSGEAVISIPGHRVFALTADEQKHLALTLLALHYEKESK